jgi:hypothetical protein
VPGLRGVSISLGSYPRAKRVIVLGLSSPEPFGRSELERLLIEKDIL